jgi:hypothetical protein
MRFLESGRFSRQRRELLFFRGDRSKERAIRGRAKAWFNILKTARFLPRFALAARPEYEQIVEITTKMS